MFPEKCPGLWLEMLCSLPHHRAAVNRPEVKDLLIRGRAVPKGKLAI
jgi:hypothetical protein